MCRFNPFIVLVTAGALFHVSLHIQGQYLHLGKCINYPVKANFSVRNYSGVWYLIEQYLKPLDVGSVCTTLRYESSAVINATYGNGSFRIWSGRITPFGVVEKYKVATVRNRSMPARFVVNEEGLENVLDEPYWVLNTDYKNWSLVWSCRRFAVFNLQTVYFLSRTQIASRWSRDKVYNNMRKLGLNTRILVKVPQSFC